MHALQELGEELVGLTEAQLAELELPEKLLDAVLLAKRISKFGALRRQLQYIGRLMRDVDCGGHRGAARGLEGQVARGHCAPASCWSAGATGCSPATTALAELAAAYPGCDMQRLRALVRNARREQAQGAAADSARELFQALKAAIPETAAAQTERLDWIERQPRRREPSGTRRIGHPEQGTMSDSIKIGLVSISDRASRGVYKDEGIPALEEWFRRALATPWTHGDPPDRRTSSR